ncbi:protein kinase family protein [Kitasatospora sp. NPDC048365]|uniref:protein kinase family protein n=1 Tax=Kitasatospora sp. NPDC048365 TaxID=3364050 RepID=UPI00371CB475
MADGTKAVVDTSAADEAALAMAVDEPSDDLGSEADDVAAPADGPGTDPAGATGDGPDAEAGDGPDDRPDDDSRDDAAGEPAEGEQTEDEPAEEESTAPLSAVEIAAELAAGAAGRKAKAAAAAKARRTAGPEQDRTPAVSTETLDADTHTLPVVRPAPLRHSGDVISGRYRLEECISQSESFSSWRAVDEKLRRAVGVHLLAAGHRRAKAVLTAARSAALLNDPRFVQVLDAVQEGDLVYVIREWLPGAQDLAGLLAGGPMEPHDAYQMVRQVTDAITAAHQRGQAHLRLTPKCVLRTESGQYRINGIAVDAALRGLSADDAERTDVRAIGALLYAALTHRWPFPEDRYDLQGLPKDLGCVPPDQVKAGVHKGLSELTARILCDNPPGHKEPITTPGQLAKAIALMPKIRQPEPPAPPALRPLPATAPPRYAAGRPTQVLPPVVEPTLPAPSPRRRRGLRTAGKWTASVLALAAIAVGSWQLVDHLNHTDASTGDHVTTGPTAASHSPLPGPVGAKLTITNLAPFNAYGETKAEHVSELPLATDGNPATAWSTQSYIDPFGTGYRPGTGLLVDLGSERPVGSVDLQFVGDHKVELRAAPAGTTAAPTADDAGFRSFGPAVATGSGATVTLKPSAPVSTRYLLIWLTGVPTDPEGGYRGKVAEIQVRS